MSQRRHFTWSKDKTPSHFETEYDNGCEIKTRRSFLRVLFRGTKLIHHHLSWTKQKTKMKWLAQNLPCQQSLIFCESHFISDFLFPLLRVCSTPIGKANFRKEREWNTARDENCTNYKAILTRAPGEPKTLKTTFSVQVQYSTKDPIIRRSLVT